MNSADFHRQSTLPNHPERKKTVSLPEHIGPYKIDSILKEGSLTTLYLGVDEKSHTPVVIKTLAPDLLSSKEMVEQFLKESEVIALTDHPNIVKILLHGEWEHGLYLATEFVQGITLMQFIKQQSLTTLSSLDIALQISYALLHLHTHGVIHRDLKPENTIISESGHVKVIDFGIAQLLHDKKRGLKGSKGRVIGTPSYMSPEQRKSPNDVTEQSDIYSLGVILYELLTGKFSEGKINLTVLSKGLREIVAKAIAPSLDERYSDIVDFIKAASSYQGEAEGSTESLEKAYMALLPKTLPDWSRFDIGLAFPKGSSLLNVYYDFIKLPDNSYLILLCESNYTNLEALTFVGMIKGMIKALTKLSGESFNAVECISALNDLIAESSVAKPMALSLLHLCPIEEEFFLISCGFQSLWHLPSGHKSPHILTSQNGLIGERVGQEFSQITDTWNEGDTLFLHSFNTKLHEKPELECIDEILSNTIPPLLQKTAHTQARTLLESLSNNAKSLAEHAPKAVLALTRIT